MMRGVPLSFNTIDTGLPAWLRELPGSLFEARTQLRESKGL